MVEVVVHLKTVYVEALRAFSTVVADGQFSTLGIVTLTLLADLASAIQISFNDLSPISRPEKIPSKQSLDIVSAVEDIGEAVCRRKDTPTLAKRPELTIQGKITSESTRTSPGSKRDEEDNVKMAKKKSRKKNTIDELFNDFL
ncbi:hypothetical protein PHISCL_06408 [Aspergillus sclerotialis]|uniref:Uncharacterized protein n=1 Tax=Aspergillus sclerotialis TaxID=2070753 RepID=A0A3A2ZIM5_9EURO|nr:hypothetical protein PHISCL_06408 [Aspergillus sclerotialis]